MIHPDLAEAIKASRGWKILAAIVWLIGAASPQTGQTEAILAPVLNTAIINQFFRALAHDVRAALIWDGANFHRAHDLKVPTNITLIPLPPYSPELNGIENLWHYLRSHCWSSRAYAHYDELFDAEYDH